MQTITKKDIENSSDVIIRTAQSMKKLHLNYFQNDNLSVKLDIIQAEIDELREKAR